MDSLKCGKLESFNRVSPIFLLGKAGILTWMEFHLSCNPVSVEMRKPPASCSVTVGSGEGKAEVSLVRGYDGLAGRARHADGYLAELFCHRAGGPHAIIKGRIFLLIPRLPSMVDLQPPMKFFSTRL